MSGNKRIHFFLNCPFRDLICDMSLVKRLMSALCIVIELKHDYSNWFQSNLIKSTWCFSTWYFYPYNVAIKTYKLKKKALKQKTGSPKFPKSTFIVISIKCCLVCYAAPCPGDKHKAVNSWSVSGHRHPENESSKNCWEELSLFPSDVQSAHFLCVFQNDSGAFETCASAAKSREVFHRWMGLSSCSHQFWQLNY